MVSGITTQNLIETQIPLHIRETNPLFVKFLAYYYQFENEIQFNSKLIQDIREFTDIDSVDLELLITFFEEYRILPNTIKSDVRFIAKRIHDLYQTKGSVESVKLLFKIIWGVDVDIKYPSNQLLRASDGRWLYTSVITIHSIKDVKDIKALKINNKTIDVIDIDSLPNDIYRIYFETTEHITNAIKAEIYSSNALIDVVELLDMPVKATPITSAIAPIGKHISIVDSNKPMIFKVSSLSRQNTVKTLEILSFGNSYINEPTVRSETITIALEYGKISRINGRWTSHHGILSNLQTKLQDNFYYQLFSYVITTPVFYDDFFQHQKKLHPAGLKCFGNYPIYATFKKDIVVSSSFKPTDDHIYLVDEALFTDVLNFSQIQAINDNVIATSLIVNNGYDLNNDINKYDPEIDWDEISLNSDECNPQYTRDIEPGVSYDLNNDPLYYNVNIDWDEIGLPNQYEQYTKDIDMTSYDVNNDPSRFDVTRDWDEIVAMPNPCIEQYTLDPDEENIKITLDFTNTESIQASENLIVE